VHENLRIAEYGHGGDYAGARRMRRAFRLCVLCCVLLTVMLWLSERYLRYELTESQYIAALTLPPESARAILRQVVKRDAELRESPTPKYIAALAEREEADLVLPTYAEAYKLDPNNAFLALRYGCQLFQQGRYTEARDRFREATAHMPQNALGRYLEAAALAWMDPDNADLGESLALVAKTNSGRDAVVYPEPLWAPTALPQQGAWYSKLRRGIVAECCAPLYKYGDLVIGRARNQIALRKTQYWDQWLGTIERMGDHLARTKVPGAVQATVGLRIRLAALEQRHAISELDDATPGPALEGSRAKLEAALDTLGEFEESREQRIAVDRERHVLPLNACWQSVALVSVFYVFAWGLSQIMRGNKSGWHLRHSTTGLAVVSLGCVGLFAVLGAMTGLAHAEGTGSSWLPQVKAVWWSLVGLLLTFGLAYPAFRLPGARAAVRNHASAEVDSETLKTVRRYRRDAYATLLRRYYGVTLGLLLCMISLWVVSYRVIFALYPWQVGLLTTGLTDEEVRVVTQALAILGP